MRINQKLTKSILVICTGSALAIAQSTNTGASGVAGAQGAGSTAGQSGAAQSGTAAGHSQHGSHAADHGMSSNKGAGLMVGQADQQFMIKAAQGGLMEVEAARLAQEKATSNEIKEFARKLEQDHTKANEDLKKLAAQKNVDLPTDMGEHKAMLEKVRNLSGDQFDKQWMKMQVSHHKKDVNNFQKETTRAMDSDVRNFASTTLPTLQGHLQQAQQLEGSTRGRKSDSGSSNSSASGSSAAGTANGTGATSSDSSARPQGANNPSTTK